MTEVEFIAYINLPNHSTTVNVWYTGNNPGQILGISIPVLGDTETEKLELKVRLEQVQQITIPQPTNEYVTLNIETRSTGYAGSIQYFYYRVTPVSATGITQQTHTGELYLSPNIDYYEFLTSPYNVLVGSVDANRESTYIQRADKSVAGTQNLPIGYTGPANINTLLSGSAERAEIQDSMYSSIGWSNGRYNGSVTNEQQFKASPAVIGTVFEGSLYPLTVPPDQIRTQISASNVIYTNFLTTGTPELPTVEEIDINFITSGSTLIQTPARISGSIFYIRPNSALSGIPSPQIGDIIKINSQSFEESVRVTGVRRPIPEEEAYEIQAVRALTNVYVNPMKDGLQLTRYASTRVYRLEGNRLSGTTRGYIVVKLSGDILKLDAQGYVLETV